MSNTRNGMTKTQALHYTERAKRYGSVHIVEDNTAHYCLAYDAFTKEFSLRYKDELHWQTVICTWNQDKILALLQA